MTAGGWALTEDLPAAAVVTVAVAIGLSLVLLLFELRRREHSGWLVALSGVGASLLLAAAVLRPVKVTTRGSSIGPRVVVLVDQSRRLLLPVGGTTRRDRALDAVKQLAHHFSEARLTVLGFGEGAPEPLEVGSQARPRVSAESDLTAAISSLSASPAERPQAIVVVTDGRLDRPGADADEAALRRSVGTLGVPVHTVKVADEDPADASIRSVRAAGAAVAHQPLALSVDIGCSGGLSCGEVPVTVRELRHGVAPALLASGKARIEGGSGQVELEVTLDQAGARVLEVAIEPPRGDEVPENDARRMIFDVARERIRLLHLAGRPTYDVRALRMWLKSDEAVDVVAFFILRGDDDDPGAGERELALIEFPVQELFTTHLSSFDAIVLQDIDAIRYKLDQYLPRVADYVRGGGGLIMVGGPSSFAGGNYAGTPLDGVLPVEQPRDGDPFDPGRFVPRYTDPGRAAPVTRKIRELLGEDLPVMPGVNYLGAPRRGSIVLWEHPVLDASGRPMPVLALGEAGDGRSIALAVDGTHRLAFSELAARVAGRAYGALWDGLLGWLMREPRYEAARVELVGECIAGEPATLRVTRLPGMEGPVELSVEPLQERPAAPIRKTSEDGSSAPVELTVEGLAPGGYAARVRIGDAPPTRQDFACESGGAAWSDTRSDPARLERIAAVTGGRSIAHDRVASLPLPGPTEIAAERHVSPVLQPWIWTLAAAGLLGAHWVARRRSGLP